MESARRVLEDLVTVARAGARLGVLTGTDVAYIEKRCDHSPVTTFAQKSRLPAHATALGKALLAFSSADILDRVIGGGLKCYTPSTVTDSDRLRQALASIRLTRVAVSRWEFKAGVSEVAVPVFGSGGIAVAALELTVPHRPADGKLRPDHSRPRPIQRTRRQQPLRLLRTDHRTACAEQDGTGGT